MQLRVGIVVGVACLLAAPAAPAATAPLVTVVGRTVALTTEYVAVTVAPGVKTKALRVRVSRATRGSSRRLDYVNAFKARFAPARTRPDAIELTVDTTKLARPGTYRVTLRVSSKPCFSAG